MQVRIISTLYVSALLSLSAAGIAAERPALNPPQSGDCYTIQSPDLRAYCLARAHADSSRCYSIEKPDLRAMCRAETKR
jgi:hypothetical protein